MRIKVLDVEIDPEARTVERSGRPLRLTPRELALLSLFARHANQVVTRDQIRQELYTDGAGRASNLVDVYVRYLRRKLGTPTILHTRRGRGYVFGADT
ncbi:MAG TPA: winged helix-turn-helix domain-containing protein [Kofleriaceae bacterium]